ncbi:MAG: archaellum component FlaC [Halobacteriales archaeon]|jgi:archaellum component FlaC
MIVWVLPNMTEQVDPNEEIEVSSDGVRVRKSFEPDEFPVPAIRFLVESSRSETASIRLAERIPEDFPMDGVGFHPDYESDNWTAYQDHHVEYNRQLDPDESVETVYGIRVGAPEEAGAFLTEPDIRVESVDEAVEETAGTIEADDEALSDTMIEDIASESDSQAVKDMIADDEAIPGLDDTDESGASADDGGDLDLDLGTDTEESAEPGDVTDDGPDDTDGPDDEGTAGADEVDIDFEDTDESDASETAEADAVDIDLDVGGSEATDGSKPATEGESEAGPGPEATAPDDVPAAEGEESSATPPVEGTESVAQRLAEELRSGEVSEDDRKAIKEALDLEPELSSAETARIEHLQSRVEEVAAYAEALEEFLDEEGTAQELISDFRTEVEELRDDVQALDDKLETVQSELDETTDQFDDMGDDLSSVDNRIDELRTDVDAIDDEVGSVASDLAAVEEDLESVEEDLEDVEEDVDGIEEWRSELGQMFTGN